MKTGLRKHKSYATAISPHECLTRIKRSIDEDGFVFSRGARLIVGHVCSNKITLRRRISYRNSFQTHFQGYVEEHGEGARIRGTFGIHPLVLAFMCVWFSGVLVIGGIITIVGIADILAKLGSHDYRIDTGALMFPIVLGFGGVLVWFGRYLARGEEALIADFIQNTVDAIEEKSA